MTVALYAGTFDPPTNGHLRVIRDAARLFDHVVVVVAVNPTKRPLFALAQRRLWLKRLCAKMPQVSVTSTEGLVVELAKEIGATVLVRGIRGGEDADAETHLAALNATLAPELSTVFLPASKEVRDVSSSKLKAMVQAGQDVSDLCPASIAAALVEQLAPAKEQRA